MRDIKRIVYQQATVHFGQPYFNTATVAGLYRMQLKELARKLGKTLTQDDSSEGISGKMPWWLET